MTTTVTINWLWLTALFPWLFWGLYVLVMGVYRAHLSRRLSKVGLVLGVAWVVVGYVVDILANLTVAVLVFRDWPREWLVTTRLQRYIAQPDTYGATRAAFAAWICTHLLDLFDPTGDHC